MDNYISKMQVYRGERLHGFVDETMLTNALKLAPKQLPQTISLIYGTHYSNYSSGLDLLTGGLGHKIELDKPSYEWTIEVEDTAPVDVICAYSLGTLVLAAANAGKNLATFQIVLKEPAFGAGAIIELDDKNYQLRIMNEPNPRDGYWEYDVVNATGDPTLEIPGKYLQSTNKVTRAGSAYEEGSDEADIISYSTGMKFRNYPTIMRLKVDITGSAKSDVLAFALKDPASGKSSYLWADFQIWKATRDFMMRRDYQAWMDKSTVRADGTFLLRGKKNVIKRSAGIDEQISPTNILQYTELSEEILDNFTMMLSYAVKGMNERKFLVLTGEMGMREFDRVLKAKLGTLNVHVEDTKFVSGSGQNLSFGGQFTSWKFPNGIEINLKLLPILDDIQHNRRLHPVSKKPISSYTMYFIDNTFRNGRSNIVKLYKKDREFVSWVIPGSCSPSGFQKGTNSFGANPIDGYSVHFLSEVSYAILDPRGCGKLEYALAD
ncbi:putative structural protein [Azobacteroides phage ProJPt-Bp1]|uniref:Putative structural protein n=1 Tax=Azobacteroides phage ProJPt-Bp1 TaxID=1920526 RepID=A0A1V1FPP1_9CAUD|nr:major head protein [Azobacteroides phage ProJPt-Bp1]BAX03432.1 putative structural protein [Azobacteroides phage ProJPt-Bp1]